MIKKIIKFPMPALKIKVANVEFPVPDMLRDHLRDLDDTLRSLDDGIALASNQLEDARFFDGAWNVFVVRSTPEWNELFEGGHVFNPSWAPLGEEDVQKEGCLSFPGMYFDLKRQSKITATWYNIDGNKYEKELEGLLARMFQHECEHLNGNLFIEQLSWSEQIKIRNVVIQRKKAGRW